jgi:hypothetical protein
MSIRFPCVNCQKRIKVSDGNHGKKVQCPSCGFQQRVPDESIEDVAPAGAPSQAPADPAAAGPSPVARPAIPNFIEPASSGSVSGHSFVHAPESSGELDPAAALAAALQGGPKAAPAKPAPAKPTTPPSVATPAAVTPVAPPKPAPVVAPSPQPASTAANKSNPPQPAPIPVVMGGVPVVPPKPVPVIVPRPPAAPPAPAAVVKPAAPGQPGTAPSRSGVVNPVAADPAANRSADRPVDPRPASPQAPVAASSATTQSPPATAPIARPASPGAVTESAAPIVAPPATPPAAPTDDDFDPLAALASLSNGASSGEIAVPVDFTLSGGESQIDPVHEMLPMSVSPAASVQPQFGAGLIVTDDIKAQQPAKSAEPVGAAQRSGDDVSARGKSSSNATRPEVPTAAAVTPALSSPASSSASSITGGEGSASGVQALQGQAAGSVPADESDASLGVKSAAAAVALSRPARPEPITMAGGARDGDTDDEGGNEPDLADELAKQQSSDQDDSQQDFQQIPPRTTAGTYSQRSRSTAGARQTSAAAARGSATSGGISGGLPWSAVAAVWTLRAIAAVLAIAVTAAMLTPDGEQFKFPLVLRVVIASVGLIVPAMAWGLAEILNVQRPGGRD